MPSALQEKIRQRHVDAVAGFQRAVTGASASMDGVIVEYLTTMRDDLKRSRNQSQDIVAAETKRLQVRQERLAQAEAVIKSLPPGGWIDSLPVDDALHEFVDCRDPKAIEIVVLDRPRRVAAERTRLLQQAQALQALHHARLAALDEAEAYLRNAECQRKNDLRSRMEQLQVELSTIAYVGVPEAQVLVQRAALDANRQLLKNDTDGVQLVAQLRAHEFYFQFKTCTDFCAEYKSCMTWMAEAITQWTVHALHAPAYRDPVPRRTVRDRIEGSLKQSKKDVGYALAGLQLMIETLHRRPGGAEASEVGDAPGGSDPQTGWLRSFVHHYAHETKPTVPFTDGPDDAHEQLRVSIDVLIDQVRDGAERSLAALQSAEDAMLQSMRYVVLHMLDHIAFVFRPSLDDVSTALSCGHTRESAAPFDATVVEDAASAQSKVAIARQVTENVITLVEYESKTVVEAIAMELFHHTTELSNSFSSRGGILPTLSDATSFLYATTTNTVTAHRQSLHFQFQKQKDYEDGLYRLEVEFADVEETIARAGSVGAAGKAFQKALAVLKSIQGLHCSNHDERIAQMAPQLQKLKTDLSEVETSLCTSLNVVTLEFVTKHNEQEAAAVAATMVATSPKGKTVTSSQGARSDRGSTSHKSSGKEGADSAPQSPNRIPVETLEQIATPGGKVFVALKPGIRFGQGTDARAGSAGSVAGAARVEAAGKGAGGKQTGKAGGAKGGASTTTAAAPAPAASSASLLQAQDDDNNLLSSATTMIGGGGATSAGHGMAGALSGLPAERRVFVERLQRDLSAVFTSDCLIATTAQQALVTTLRVSLLKWIVVFSSTIFEKLNEFFSATKTKLDADTNDRIRIHYRRAPTLQTHVYDVRIRELDDALQSKEKHFTWLTSRVDAATAELAENIANTWSPVEDAVKQLAAMKAELPGILSAQGLDSKVRASSEVFSKTRARRDEQLQKVLHATEQALQGVLRECTSYESERIKTFDEGGSLSSQEAQVARQECKAIMDAANRAQSDAKDLVEEARVKQNAALDLEKAAFHKDHALHVAEVNVLRRLAELVGSLRSKASGLIATSASASQRIDSVIQAIEHLTAAPATGFKKELPAVLSFADLDLDSPVAAPLPASDGAAVSGSVDVGAWQADDVVAASLLRRAKVTEATFLPKSKAAELLTVLDDLRKILFTRGVSLGCLAWGAEFLLVAPEGYFDPKKALGGATAEAESTAAAVAGKKPGAPAAAPAASKGGAAAAKGGAAASGAKGGSGGTAGQPDVPLSQTPPLVTEDPLRFMKPARIDGESSRLMASMKEQLVAAATAYFKETPALPGAPTPFLIYRSDLFGADLPAVQKTISLRIMEQEKRIAEHIQDSVKMYKDQLQRVSVIIHRAAPEIFAAMVNASVDSVDLRLREILAVFTAFCLSGAEAKRQHQSELKASMGAPCHGNRLQILSTQETTRHTAMLALGSRTTGALLAELQDASYAYASRCAHTLSVFFALTKSLMTLDHMSPIAAGEEVLVAGEHRSIKRLMRLKQREDAAKALEGAQANTAAGAQAGKGASTGKPGAKPEAPAAKKAPAGKPLGKNGKPLADNADDDTLPVLDRHQHEFAGLALVAVKCFDVWRKRYPEVALKQYDATGTRAVIRDDVDADAAAGAAGGKKAPAGAKAPAAKPAAAAKPSAAIDDASAAAGGSAVASATLLAPRDRLHQSAWLCRQQSADHFAAVMQRAAEALEKKLAAAARKEQSWATSWKEALHELQHGV